jgi:DNA-directed RNA polymerase subunit L
MTCPICHGVHSGAESCPNAIITNKPIEVKTYHADHDIDIKISNDNTKGERRCTIHVRSDGDPEEAMKKAIKLYKDGLAN